MTKSKSLRGRLGAGALTAGLLAVGGLQAGAAPITVPNQSFEQHVGASIVDWTGGFTDPASSGLPIQFPATGVYNASLAGNYTVRTAQTDTGYVIGGEGETFTLTVAIGRPVPSILTSADYLSLVNLQVNGITVASNTLLSTQSFQYNVGPDTFYYYWVDATVTYTSVLADVGKTVGVLLGGPAYIANDRRYFDNVRLDAIPEPGTSALLIGAAAAFMGRRKLRRILPQ